MVPLRLELKNFLSYGELQAIDFSNYNLVCLSGKNGHGKSAILDALTWALWGQARKPSGTVKPDENLLKLGQTKMFVILEFKVDKQVYRVRREFIKSGGKSVANLELAIASQNSTYSPLTEKTIRLTQKKIDSILKIDFETFTNSSFLRQGNAGEFSKKSPRERKLLLTKILGFDLYDKMQQKALDTVKENSLRLKIIILEEQKNEALVSELPTLIENKKVLSEKLIQNKRQLALAKDHKHLLDEKRLIINSKIEDVKLLVEQKQVLEKEIITQKTKALETIKLWRSNHSQIILCKQTNLTAGNKDELTALEAKQHNLEKQLLDKMNTSEQLSKIKEEYLHKKQLLNNHERQQLAINKLLLLKSENIEIIKGLQEVLAVKISEDDILATKNQISKIEKILFLFSEQKRAIQSRAQKYNLQSMTPQTCPTCKQSVSDNIGKVILESQRKALIKDRHLLARISRLQSNFSEQLYFEKNLLQTRETQRREILICRSKQNDLKKQVASQDIELTKLQQTIDPLPTMPQQFTNLEEKIISFEQTLNKLADTEKEFASCKEQLTRTRTNVEIFQNLQHKVIQQHFFIDRLIETKKLIVLAKDNKKTLDAKLSHTEQLKKDYFELKSEWERLSAQILNHEQEQNKILQEHATAEALVLFREKLAEETKKINLEIADLKKNVYDYELLAEAFSKNGIQAFLIEDVIPEIEQATNQILEAISETHAKVFIEPLRDLKKGGVRESLDITISDINGIRDYEMFSGGEAFRIDFAIRIGISQVIASRCGTNLKTLIIDEGFGSLDEEGIGLMMNCLYKISNHFEKVIVVSHLPALKEMFPVHLNVTKNGCGSSVSIEYRG